MKQSFVAPLAFGVRAKEKTSVEIISGTDCLSQESAAGFRLLLNSVRPANGMLIVCGPSAPGGAADRANRGEWILHELSPDPVISDASDGLFVRYDWPHTALVRTFLGRTPLPCSEEEVIARYAGVPVAMKRRIGRGGVVVLGSMLGPSLYAQDREAHRLAAAMIQGLRS